MSIDTDKQEENNLYIRFRLGNDQYASRLIDVHEVLEYTQPKSIPNGNPFFEGVLNVRGEIVGVIDLRKLLKYDSGIRGKEVLLLFENSSGRMACIVDGLIDVKAIAQVETDSYEKLKTRIRKEYIRGLVINETGFDTVVDLKVLLEDFELTTQESAKVA